jgi:predicted ATPase
MIEDMIELHREIFLFLRKKNFTDESFLFTLRKSDRYKRLSKGYWFHGNDNYLAVSFWSGTAWKNRTPNINFIINRNGATELHVDVRDSLRKREFVTKFLFSKKFLPLAEEKAGKFYLRFDSSSYIESLSMFLDNEKKYIDKVIEKNKSFFNGKFSENKIGFLKLSEFDYYRDRILLKIQENRLEEIEGNFCSISKILINDFGAIKSNGLGVAGLPIDSPFIFLTGENGSGKSSILRALTLAMVPDSNEHKVFIKNAEKNPRILVELNKGQVPITILTTKEHIKKKRKFLCEGFAAYGPSRLITTQRIHRRLRGKVSDTYSIFYPDGQLLDIESEVLRWKTLKSILHLENRLDIIKEVLISSISGLGDIKWGHQTKSGKIIPTKYFEADDDGNTYDESGVAFDQLASGIRSLIAMIGDMLLRLFRTQNNITDARSLFGIVIIDEIDIHLHPKLQKEIIEILAENFQNVQFVITTHSPIPLLGAPKGSVFIRVRREHKEGVVAERLPYLEKNIAKMLPNVIYSSDLFSFESIIQNEFSFNESLGTEDNYNEHVYNQILEKRILKLKDKYNT